MKRRGFEHPAKVGHQDVVRGRADRPAATTPCRRPCRLPPRRHTGAGAVPHAAEPAARQTPDGWRSTGRHSSRRPPPGQRAAGLQLVHLRVSNSVSISSSPILACSYRRWSSSRALRWRLFRPGCPAARNEPASATPAHRRDPHRPRHGLEVLPRATDAALPHACESRPRTDPHGRARLATPVASDVLNVLPHLDTPLRERLSQSSGQENPRAQEARLAIARS